MRLLKFLLLKRLGYFFSTKNWTNLFIEIYYLVSLLLIAYGSSQFYNSDFNKKKSGYPLLGLIFFGVIVFSLPIIVKFFPSFKQKRNYIDNKFPLEKRQIVFIDIIVFSLMKTLNFSIVISIITFYLFSNDIDSYELMLLFLLFLFGFLLSEGIINAISWRKKLFGFISLLMGVLILFYFVYADFFHIWVVNLLLVTFIITHFIIYYYYYDTKKKEYIKYTTVKKSKRKNSNYIIKILKNKQLYTSTLNIAFFIKTAFLTLYFLTAKIVIVNGFPDNILIFIFVTPALLFTYVYNNTWGFFKAVVINEIIAKNSLTAYFKLYMKLVIPALIVDLLISFLSMAIFKYNTLNTVVTYCVLSFFYFSLGFLSSFIRYINIDNEISFKTLRTNTSQLISLFNVLPIVVLFICYKDSLSLLIFEFSFILLSGIIFFFVFKYPKHLTSIPRQKIFSSIQN